MTGAVRNPPGRWEKKLSSLFLTVAFQKLWKDFRLKNLTNWKTSGQRFCSLKVLIQNHIAAMVCEYLHSPELPIRGRKFRYFSCFNRLKLLECSYNIHGMFQTPSELHLIVSHHVCHCWSPMTHAATAANACVAEAFSFSFKYIMIYLYKHILPLINDRTKSQGKFARYQRTNMISSHISSLISSNYSFNKASFIPHRIHVWYIYLYFP